MLPQPLHEVLKKLLAQHFNHTIKALNVQAIGGGSINQTCKLTFSNTHTLFCKINDAEKFPQLFSKEARGLDALRKTNSIKTPNLILNTIYNGHQILLLEWIESGPKTTAFFKTFGEQLAALHQSTNARFGWFEDNYMGSVSQQNNFTKDWNTFFVQQRLEPLAQQCLSKNLLAPDDYGLLKKLYEKLPYYFDDSEKPALLHGDLWSGNYMCSQAGEPVLIDPAVYYGHRCIDLAMTTLFGGFDKHFYESYHYHFPLPEANDAQLKICNLYPLLIHLLLFGKSYLTSVQQTLRYFL